SFIYFQKALDWYQKQKHTDSVVYVNVAIAELFRYRNSPQQAKYYITEAERGLNKNASADIVAYMFNRKAAIEALFFDPAKAIAYSQKVIAMKNHITNKELLLYSYNELGYQFEKSNPEKSRG